MIGLEKEKARNGEVSESVKAMSVEMMRHLYNHLIAHPSEGSEKFGSMKYVSFANLLFEYLCAHIHTTVVLSYCFPLHVPNGRGRLPNVWIN